MLRSLNDLKHYDIRATDGPIGDIADFYFDDHTWTVRYVVVDAGTWLSSRKVLISPMAVRQPDWAHRTLPLNLSKTQVKNSPDIDTNQPVSRQNESQVLGYYGYPSYWEGGGLWGEGMLPYSMAPGYGMVGVERAERYRQLQIQLDNERARHAIDDPHLRSAAAVEGYTIEASDGEIGHVSDFLVDDQTWAIRYLVVNTSNWWVGHHVLVAPPWIQGVHWSDRTVSIAMTCAAIKSAPTFETSADWSREQEINLHRHHDRRGYWVADKALPMPA